MVRGGHTRTGRTGFDPPTVHMEPYDGQRVWLIQHAEDGRWLKLNGPHDASDELVYTVNTADVVPVWTPDENAAAVFWDREHAIDALSRLKAPADLIPMELRDER